MSRKRGSDKSTFQARARESLKRKLLQISCIANIYTERVSREREREREREKEGVYRETVYKESLQSESLE